MMSSVPKDNFRLLLHLVSTGAVAAATVGVFFGVGFVLLAPPRPTAPSEDPVPPAQALEAHEVTPPGGKDTVWALLLPASPIEKVAASPAADAPPNREAPVVEGTGLETALVPAAGNSDTKRVVAGRHRHQKRKGENWAALWRSDASAGPNPGGGFYGPPNVNVGYINPR
jgi:hypothetical protein